MLHCQHFTSEKKLSCVLILKNLNKQLFFIINDGEVGRYYPCFINSKAGR